MGNKGCYVIKQDMKSESPHSHSHSNNTTGSGTQRSVVRIRTATEHFTKKFRALPNHKKLVLKLFLATGQNLVTSTMSLSNYMFISFSEKSMFLGLI